jgi:hypothetical protein
MFKRALVALIRKKLWLLGTKRVGIPRLVPQGTRQNMGMAKGIQEGMALDRTMGIGQVTLTVYRTRTQ